MFGKSYFRKIDLFVTTNNRRFSIDRIIDIWMTHLFSKNMPCRIMINMWLHHFIHFILKLQLRTEKNMWWTNSLFVKSESLQKTDNQNTNKTHPTNTEKIHVACVNAHLYFMTKKIEFKVRNKVLIKIDFDIVIFTNVTSDTLYSSTITHFV